MNFNPIIDKCLEKKEIFNEREIFDIIEFFVDSLKINKVVKKNCFTKDIDRLSVYSIDGKCVYYNLEKIIDRAKRYADTFNLEDGHKIILINLLILRMIIGRLYKIHGFIEYDYLKNSVILAKDNLLSKNMYNSQMKFYNPFERVANVSAAYYIADTLIYPEYQDIKDIFMYEVLDRRCMGYYQDHYFFPLNRFFSAGEIAIPPIPEDVDRTLLGAMCDMDEVDSMIDEKNILLRKIM